MVLCSKRYIGNAAFDAQYFFLVKEILCVDELLDAACCRSSCGIEDAAPVFRSWRECSADGILWGEFFTYITDHRRNLCQLKIGWRREIVAKDRDFQIKSRFSADIVKIEVYVDRASNNERFIDVGPDTRGEGVYPSAVGFNVSVFGYEDAPDDADCAQKSEDGGSPGKTTEPARSFKLSGRDGYLLRPGLPLYMFVAFFVVPSLVGFCGLFLKDSERRIGAFFFAFMGLSGYALFLILSEGELWQL